MKTIKVKVYTYSELDEKAQERARNWYLKGAFDYPWYDFIQEDFESFLGSMGFEDVKTHFSGFNSQGDGASFDFKSLDFQALINLNSKDFNPYSGIFNNWKLQNKKLLNQLNRFYLSFSTCSGKTSFSNHYCHEKTRFAMVESNFQTRADRCEKKIALFESSLTDLMIRLSHEYYIQLNNHHDYLNSEESIKENIEANEYTFTKDGKRFG